MLNQGQAVDDLKIAKDKLSRFGWSSALSILTNISLRDENSALRTDLDRQSLVVCATECLMGDVSLFPQNARLREKLSRAEADAQQVNLHSDAFLAII